MTSSTVEGCSKAATAVTLNTLARAKKNEVTMSNQVVEATTKGIFSSKRGDIVEHVYPYQFSVREEVVTTASGVVVPDRRVIVREDTNTALGIVGSNYKVLTHSEALDPILDELSKRKVETFKRISLAQDGAKMFANIYFPDQELSFDSPSGKKDHCWPGITVVNSLDGTLKYLIEATIYRLACTNGMRVPFAIASMKTTHSKNKNYEEMVEEILNQIGDASRFVSLQKWANHVIEPDKMAALAEKIIGTKGCLFPARYLDQVKGEIKKESKGGVTSAWGLYNAFNSVLEHNLVRGKGKVERARMLDENLFKVFSKTFK